MPPNPSKTSIKHNNFMDLVNICNQGATLALAVNQREKDAPESPLINPDLRRFL